MLRSAPLIAFALAIVFLGLSLGGYDPADPPGWGAEPANQPAGQSVRARRRMLRPRVVHDAGLVVWLLVLGAGGDQRAPESAAERCPTGWVRRSGSCSLLIVAAGFIHRLAPTLGPSPPVGSGGYIGRAGRDLPRASLRPGRNDPHPRGVGLFGWRSATRCCSSGRPGARGWISAATAPAGAARRRITPARSMVDPRDRASAITRQLRRDPRAHLAADHHLVWHGPPAATECDPGARPVVAPGDRVAHGRVPSAADYPPVAGSPPGCAFRAAADRAPRARDAFPIQEHEAKVNARAMLLERTLLDFGYQVRVVQIDTGPVITQFEIELEAGLRVSKIMSLADDLAIALAVPSVRIVAPIPGKKTVGIEVPNDHRNMVRLGEVIDAAIGERSKKCRIPLFLGKDVKGKPLVVRPGRHAAPADRRPHRHGQVGLPERDDPVDPDDPAARRGEDDPDRPQDGRARRSTSACRT